MKRAVHDAGRTTQGGSSPAAETRRDAHDGAPTTRAPGNHSQVGVGALYPEGEGGGRSVAPCG